MNGPASILSGRAVVAMLFAIGCAAGSFSPRPAAAAPPPATFYTRVPASEGNVILARPTDHSITLSIVRANAITAKALYGPSGKPLDHETAPIQLRAGVASEVLLADLPANAACEYRIVDAATSQPLFPAGTFHTARPPGEPFVFTMQADSHLDENCDPDLYRLCLANVAADRPDFHMDLGDTFMTGKHPSRESAAPQYTAQRYYLGALGIPLLLTIGNHDGEEIPRGREANITGRDSLPVWSCLQRKAWFPNPEPGPFYSGNSQPDPYAGLLQDYYAFTWGDVLIVVLDPYWTSQPNRGGREPWNMTLGKRQYDFLATTLRASTARYKLIFIHQLVGGLDAAGRGGAEAVPLYEWGGHEPDGGKPFAQHRPGWDKPIHDLLLETRATAVFHGHDHFYASQFADGILYQLVPQPGQRSASTRQIAEYGYKAGTLLPSPGHLRLSVSPDRITVDYVRALLPAMERPTLRNRDIAHSVTLSTR